jgi:hypothetical protein
MFVDYGVPSSTSHMFSAVPTLTTDITINALYTWLMQNNIEQGLEVVGVLMAQTKGSSEIEKTIKDEINNELTVVQYILDHVYTQKRFHSSCWYMGDWRTGSLNGTMNDLVTSLRLITCKLNLIAILRDSHIR